MGSQVGSSTKEEDKAKKERRDLERLSYITGTPIDALKRIREGGKRILRVGYRTFKSDIKD